MSKQSDQYDALTDLQNALNDSSAEYPDIKALVRRALITGCSINGLVRLSKSTPNQLSVDQINESVECL